MSYKINSFIATDKDVASYEKRLSICLASNGFSFSLTGSGGLLLAFGEAECSLDASMSELIADIRECLMQAGIQPIALTEAEFIVFSRQFVWIPAHLYDDSRKRSYLDALCKVDGGCDVYVDYNESVNAHIVFSADSNIVSAFKIAVPGLRIRCQHSKMVNDINVGESDLKTLLLMNVREGAADYAVFCNKKLQISNTFDCASFDETVYNALNITKVLKLEDAQMTLSVCGNIGREQFALLRGYFPNVELYTGRKHKFMVAEMQHIPAYRYALILS